LKAGSSTALGAGGLTSGETVIHAGATLDVNGQQLNGEGITVSGDGVGNAGAIVNSGAQQTSAIGRLTLAGNTTIGGSGRWDVRGGGASVSAGLAGYNLTKVGTNQISFVAATIDPLLGDVDIKEGVLAIQTATALNSTSNGGGGFGDPEKTITIRSGATLNTYNLGTTASLTKKIAVESGGTIWNENSVSMLAGPITLNGTATFNAGGTSLNIDGVISGSGGVNKTGTGALILNANNTYTGQTTVNTGSLQLTDNGSIASSAVIEVHLGANVAVNRGDLTLTLSSGQTLAGNGAVNGSVVAPAGSFVAPGLPTTVGTLTINGDATLQGTTAIGIDAANHTNDVLKANTVTLGGELHLGVTGALQGGDTFKVVDALSIGGSFTSITPATPGVGQTWDTTQLLVDGTIKVVGNSLPKPTVGATGVVGGNFNINGSGGTVGVAYKILATSDLSLALADWTIVAQGTFDANGNFNASIPTSTAPYRFFVVSVGGN
jgi:autotransporter-associated beta strand protein